MSVTLCLDFGNTRMKLGVFQQDRLQDVIILENDGTSQIESILAKYKPLRSILSSVIDHNPDIEYLLAEKTKYHRLNHLSKLPFTTPVGKPETIGADRLALAAAAVHFYPRQHNLVIGLGTCITYNFINKFHAFTGGAISPGLEMRLKSLNYYTARLPLERADWNVPLIGYDTRTNILTGVIMGMAMEINGFSASYAQKFSNFNVLLTGGDIVYLASHIKSKIFADSELIFKGLYAISEVNNA
ncbi:MAG: type III pantothenate kinase [Terrimonas sp.]|nr:type III pantothenate kinase [Terrimonas sp.]